jgi:hypothetical protein
MINLRDYQIEISKKACDILKEKRIVYLAMQVRTGKTLTALNTVMLFGANNVLFLTKKKAISSIIKDYKEFGYTFNLTVINDEQIEKLDNNYDLIIHDEHHRFGAFPKPSKRVQLFKQKYGYKPMIFLSGTPAAESYSQMFHQFWVSHYSPFRDVNFYAWSKNYVNVKQKKLGYATVNDYSDANVNLIDKVITPYVLKFTQEESGFQSKVNEHILYFPSCCERYTTYLEENLIIQGKGEVILGDTGAKLMSKIHQLESGTIKFESGNTMTLDKSKAEFIRDHFKGKKIAIFYYYIEELELLQSVFLNHTLDLNEFNTTDKVYIGQQYSNALGVNLSKADCLVFYNFGFSGTNYIQSIDRLTTKERMVNDVYFVYGKKSLTEKIHKVVKKKKNFTSKMYERVRNSK